MFRTILKSVWAAFMLCICERGKQSPICFPKNKYSPYSPIIHRKPSMLYYPPALYFAWFSAICRTFVRYPRAISIITSLITKSPPRESFGDFLWPLRTQSWIARGISAKILTPPTLLDFYKKPLISPLFYTPHMPYITQIIDRRTNIRKNNREQLFRICYNIITAKRKERTLWTGRTQYARQYAILRTTSPTTSRWIWLQTM